MAPFTRLTTLLIHFVMSSLSPTEGKLAFVLQSNPSLVQLSLRVTTLAFPSPSAQPRILLPNLEDLELATHGDPRIGDLMMGFVVPKLKSLAFKFYTREDLDFLLRCPDLLCRVQTFIVSSNHSMLLVNIEQLLSSMPALNDLDLTYSCMDFFRALSMERFLSPQPICPLLKTFVVAEVDLASLWHFVKRRSECNCAVDRLHAHYINEPYDPEDPHSLASHLANKAMVDVYVEDFQTNPVFIRRFGWARCRMY
ncbi:hypothetical protein FB451DRAFT_1173125 [Mycena latifolia]|nr:hypothetical protein FB451DRAFT_1173125 [Mycena latifolia]